jgi:lipoprotein-anchoring transpeptidase ErfK/SrfK
MAAERFWGSPKVIMGAAVALVVAVLGGVVVISVDRHASARLRSGTIIEDVPVGGLDFDGAVTRVRAVVEQPLRRPLLLKTDRFEVTTTPWDLGFRVDVPGVVRSALRSSGGNVFTRLGERVLGPNEPLFVDAPPAWGDGDLEGVLSRAAEAVKEAPQNADIDISSGFLKFTPERAGRDLDVDASRHAIMQAAELGDSTVRLVTRALTAGVGEQALNKVILVRTGENKLYLYDKGTIVKTWSVATGQSSYPTPTGVYKVVSKIENPSWYNPGSDWSRGLPAVIGPGPSNPLGTKALELDAPGILIHATSDRGSIGYNASHGCIRMTEESEAELFSQVPEGTRVAIVSAEAAKSRGADTPAPATPEATAAVVF